MTSAKSLKTATSRPFSYNSIDFVTINSLPSTATLYKAINWGNFDFSSLASNSGEALLQPLLRWEFVDLAKASRSPSFSINFVDWGRINTLPTAPKTYKSIKWVNINWNLLEQSTLDNLNWTLVDLKSATKSSSFNISKIDWNEVNNSASAANIYRAIDWSKINWDLVDQGKQQELDWAQVNLSKAKLGNGFNVNIVQWDEVNKSSTASKSYMAIDWRAIDASTLSQLAGLDSNYLPKDLTSEPNSGGGLATPSGVAIDSQKLRSSLLASKAGTSSNNSIDLYGSTSQSSTFKSTYQYLLDNTSRPLIVREIRDSTFSQVSNGESLSGTDQETRFYYYSYRPSGFSLATFSYEFDYDMFNGADLYDVAVDLRQYKPILEEIKTFQAYGSRGIALEELYFRTDGSPTGLAGFAEPVTLLAGGGGSQKVYSNPPGVYIDIIGQYYIDKYLEEAVLGTIKTSSIPQGFVTTVTSNTDSTFKGSLSYQLASGKFEYVAEILDFPLRNLDKVSVNLTGAAYTGGFSTYLQWLATDQLLFEDSSIFENGYLGFIPNGDPIGRGPSELALRAQFLRDNAQDDEYPSESNTGYVIDPLTGQYLSGQSERSDQDTAGLDQYSFNESEDFSATYSQDLSGNLTWVYDAEIVASMDQQIDTALGRFTSWAADQPALFTPYWA